MTLTAGGATRPGLTPGQNCPLLPPRSGRRPHTAASSTPTTDAGCTASTSRRGPGASCPADPLAPPLTDGSVFATDDGLVLTGVNYEEAAPDEPTLTQADLWDGSSWQRLPRTGMIGPLYHWTGERLVGLEIGGADGGQVNGWDRWYPYAGALDVATGRWSEIPARPRLRGPRAGPRHGHLAGRGVGRVPVRDHWLRLRRRDRQLEPPRAPRLGAGARADRGLGRRRAPRRRWRRRRRSAAARGVAADVLVRHSPMAVVAAGEDGEVTSRQRAAPDTKTSVTRTGRR